MSLLNIFDISGSALSAQSQRLNVSASNMANADSATGPDGQPYRAKQVVFEVAAAPGQSTGGVRVAQVVDDPRRSAWCFSRVTRWRMPKATCECPTSM